VGTVLVVRSLQRALTMTSASPPDAVAVSFDRDWRVWDSARRSQFQQRLLEKISSARH